MMVHSSRSDLSFRGVLLYSTALQIATVPLGFLNGVVVARLLGPEGRGVLTVVQVAATTLMYFLGFGLAGSTTVIVGRSADHTSSVIGGSALIAGFASILSIAVLSVEVVRRWLGASSFEYAIIICCLVGLTSLLSSLKSIVIGLQRYRFLTLFGFIIPVVTLLLNSTVLWFSHGSVSAALVIIVAIPAISAIWIFSQLRQWSYQLKSPDYQLMKQLVAIGLRVVVTNAAGYLLLRSDVFFLNRYWPSSVVGIYGVGTAVAELSFLLPTTLNTLLFTKAAAGEELKEHVAAATHLAFFVGAVFVLLLVIFGRSFFAWVFGTSYSAAYEPAVWVGIGAAAWAAASPVTGFVSGRQGFPLRMIIITLLSLLLNLVLAVLWVPAGGAIAAGKATAVSYFFYASLVFLFYWRTAGAKWIDLVRLGDAETRLLLGMRTRMTASLRKLFR